MNALLEFFATLTLPVVYVYLLIENILLFLLSLAFGRALLVLFGKNRVVE